MTILILLFFIINTPEAYPVAVDLFAPPKALLSEYGFFTGRLADLKPAEHVFPYEVNAPLFSDYAEKARFIALPPGARMEYRADGTLEFPVGTVLIKNFYYHDDARKPENGRRIIETRLLLREAKGWKALEYRWNDEQTDATLEVAGARFPVGWTDAAGKSHTIDYVLPNLNQCKGCHSYDGQFVPLGTTTRQLNRTENGLNQLHAWKQAGWLQLPDSIDLAGAPQLTDYRAAGAGLLNSAARAYLDANCGHCHNPHGPASTSGMYLDIHTSDPLRLGVLKAPVAAGRGSGNRKYGIVPGKPHESILLYRMENGDPGVRMPELGRQIPHREGIELIEAWIREMK